MKRGNAESREERSSSSAFFASPRSTWLRMRSALLLRAGLARGPCARRPIAVGPLVRARIVGSLHPARAGLRRDRPLAARPVPLIIAPHVATGHPGGLRIWRRGANFGDRRRGRLGGGDGRRPGRAVQTVRIGGSLNRRAVRRDTIRRRSGRGAGIRCRHRAAHVRTGAGVCAGGRLIARRREWRLTRRCAEWRLTGGRPERGLLAADSGGGGIVFAGARRGTGSSGGIRGRTCAAGGCGGGRWSRAGG